MNSEAEYAILATCNDCGNDPHFELALLLNGKENATMADLLESKKIGLFT